MSRLNQPRPTARTFEGAPAYTANPALTLRRSVSSCLLWESQFYEDGIDIAARIASLVPLVPAPTVSALAIEAREQMHLRHVPLLLAAEMAKHPTHRTEVTALLARIIQRPDELTELLAIYSRDRSGPKKLNRLAKCIQHGIAAAFPKFDEYQLAKYNRKQEIRLRDALFLSHAKPRDEAQAALWKRLVADQLATPDTWEVALSAATDKTAAWTRLVSENKLGALALLRNLRNMQQANLPFPLLRTALAKMHTNRVLPFRFIAAAKHAPQLEPELEEAMLRSLSEAPRLPGLTVLLIDHSGSMVGCPISARSEIDRFEAACGLAILARELCEEVRIFAFSDWLAEIPPRRGFALRDAIANAGSFWGTYLGRAVSTVESVCPHYDRLIVLTDEQSHDSVLPPSGRGYMLNVASYRNGIGYGPWLHIDGWSESALSYIRQTES